ncbi:MULTISPECIES: hypothetical protein [unclassified Micromonospora]|uniref:hypothetical protein n=1 Tax=unclassified Micromonospora TaxID=2617518 RepID=UPI0022B5FCCD|nr:MULTISPECIES: hypothetical protein [unclassified Micromonospora]MCZ7423648.1 hypothetical protein [Verrucosispora sp. WMMA2121]WBB91337.1 hypothetical protein O7597_31005 [Verrucosispora sp. WMMC514]
MAGPRLPALRRGLTHPAVWSVPAMALLVLVAMPFNDAFYGLFVNYDGQGEAQQHELMHSTRIFRYTSGLLCGQVLALLAGIALAGRNAQARALAVAVAVPLSVLLAGVAVAAAYPLARGREGVSFTTPALDDPILVRVLLSEAAAYPFYAAAGVGLGALLGERLRRPATRWPLVLLLLLGWFVTTMTGLLQDDRFAAPYALLWTVPPIAAGTAIALAGLSTDVWAVPPVTVGDWGRGASTALLVSAAAYALGLNLLAHWTRRARGEGRRVAGPPVRPG